MVMPSKFAFAFASLVLASFPAFVFPAICAFLTSASLLKTIEQSQLVRQIARKEATDNEKLSRMPVGDRIVFFHNSRKEGSYEYL